jgi:hypothetical protein
MNALYTDEQKKAVIARFIYERGNENATIYNYSPITECMNKKRIALLCALNKSGSKYDSFHNVILFYTDDDAQTYVEWLISAVSGTIEESITENMFKRAVNQLFMFLFNLSGTLHSEVDLLTPCQVNDELEARLKGYDTQLASLELHMNVAREKIKQDETRVDHMNDKIITALDTIQKWQQVYQPYLDDLKNEREAASNLEKSLKGRGKDEKK